jgi:hypothetical protein
MLDELFSSVLTNKKASAIVLDMVGRVPAVSLAVVTDNVDPDKYRKILVSSPFLPGLDTNWIRRLQTSPGFDPPMPEIGDTVLLLSVAGDLLNTYYLNVVNQTNPPIPGKKEIIKDSYQEIPGSLTTEAKKTINIFAGDSIKFSTSSGSYLELTKEGSIVLSDAAGVTVNLTGSGDVTLANKSILTIGSVDTRGDQNISKGW